MRTYSFSDLILKQSNEIYVVTITFYRLGNGSLDQVMELQLPSVSLFILTFFWQSHDQGEEKQDESHIRLSVSSSSWF